MLFRSPQFQVRIRVPLWGVRGVGSVFLRDSVGRVAARGVPIAMVEPAADVSEVVVLIDARGRGLQACLYPSVVDDGGRRVHDVGTLSSELAALRPPVRFVQSSASFETLQSRVTDGSGFFLMPASRNPLEAMERRYADGGSGAGVASQPTGEVKRRAKRTLAVRSAMGGGRSPTEIVLTKADAEKLAKSPEAAGAMKNSQVLVVVDAAAAGTEGRLPTLEFDRVVSAD